MLITNKYGITFTFFFFLTKKKQNTRRVYQDSRYPIPPTRLLARKGSKFKSYL